MRCNRWFGGFLLALTVISVSAVADHPPVARFAAYRAGDGVPTTITLDASESYALDGTVVSYQWLFGDGATGSGAVVSHTYPSASEYTVSLLIRDNRGIAGRIEQAVDLSRLTTRQAATGFSPSGVPLLANVPVGHRVGERAPAFSLLKAGGEIAQLSDYLGRVVLLEFWSRACGSCVAALPYVDHLRAQYAERGLVVLLVSVHRDPAGDLMDLQARGFPELMSLREMDPSQRPTMVAYRVTRVPHAFLVDHRGVIRYSGHINVLHTAAIEELLAGVP